MGTLKYCLAKIKKAGYDTSLIDVRALEAASDMDAVIKSRLEVLGAEHRDLNITRTRLMNEAARQSPEMKAAVKEHRTAERGLNETQEGLDAQPKEKATVRQQSENENLAQQTTNKLGLPRKAADQGPPQLKNLGKTVAETKATLNEEETAKASEVIRQLRRAQGTGKEYHELSVDYAIKKARALGRMKEIRAMFPKETSNRAAMKKFQAVAKNQIAQEKADEAPVFNKRQTKQLGAFNEEVIAQRADEEVEGRGRESSPDEVLEGVTEHEPTPIETTIEPYVGKNGKPTEVVGIVGIARRLKNFFPGSTLFRTASEKSPGLNSYTVRQEQVEEVDVDGSPQELLHALMKVFVDGRRTGLKNEDGSPNRNVVVLYDSKTGVAVPVGSVSVTKLGSVVDQKTNDSKMKNIEKSIKQFNAGLTFLLTDGGLSLKKPVKEKTAAELEAENKAAKPEPTPVKPDPTKIPAAAVRVYDNIVQNIAHLGDRIAIARSTHHRNGHKKNPATVEIDLMRVEELSKEVDALMKEKKNLAKQWPGIDEKQSAARKEHAKQFRSKPKGSVETRNINEEEMSTIPFVEFAEAQKMIDRKKKRLNKGELSPKAAQNIQAEIEALEARLKELGDADAKIAARIAEIDKTGDPRIAEHLATLGLDVLNAIESVEWMSKAQMNDHPNSYATTEMSTGIIRFNGLKVKEKPGKLQKATKHEAGHVVDAELNMKPSKEWLTQRMVAEAHEFANGDVPKMKILFAAVFDKYKPVNWPKEIVAQLFYGYHNNPKELKHAWPDGYALAEKMNDELRRKREYLEAAAAKRSADGAQGSGQKAGQQGSAQVQESGPGQISLHTVIDTRGNTLGKAQRSVQKGAEYAAKAVTGEVDVAAPVFDQGHVPDDLDVRKHEKEEAQQQRGKSGKTSPELVGATLPENRNTPGHEEAKRIFSTQTQRDALGNVPAKFLGMMNSLFTQLGIKTKVIVVDKEGASELLKEQGLPRQWKANLEAVLADQPVGRLMLSDSNVASERFAVVYIDTSKPAATQQEAFLHELGHIVQLAKLDQASDEVQSALRDAHKHSGSQAQFEEWFANQLLKWSGSNKAAKTVLEKFFQALAQALRKLWRRLKVDSTYAQFMDSLVAAEAAKRGAEVPKSGKHRDDWIEDMSNSVDSPFLSPQERSHYNFTPEPRGQTPGVKRKGAKIVAWAMERAEDLRENAAYGFTAGHRIFTQTADSYLRNNGLEWLADHFHKRPDVDRARITHTTEMQIRAHQAQFEPLMDKIIAKMPKKKGRGFFTNHNDPVYKQAVEDLIGQVDNPSPLAKEILKYFQAQEKYLRKHGIDFKTRKKYFPIMLDRHQWMTRRDKVVAIAMEKLGKTEKQAYALYNEVLKNPGAMFDMSTEYDPRTAGTFGHTQSRKFGPREHKAFIEFIDTDLVSVVKNYTHASAKHVVYKQHFGSATGPGKSDPLHQLKMDLTRAVINGEITQEVYDRTWNVVLPGLFGQLGADMDPGLRKMQSGLVFFQNVRLLGTAVLASLVDPVNVMYRSGTLRGQWKGLRKAMQEMGSKEAQATYRTLGIIRDDLTEAIVNDPTHTQFYSPKIRRLNELFFKANGMHTLTNWSRIYSFTMGKEYLLEKAKAGNTKALSELGVTAEEVLNWDKNGQNYDLSNIDDSGVLYALHQFVDESILRPSAAMRPSWMSDQRFLLLANLKSFIFTYHETILRRIWSQVKGGDFKDPSILLPFVGFAAIALTVSMIGYELRRQIMHAGDVPEYARADALDYMWEGVQRAGMLGVTQFLVDSIEAENRGNMALMSLLGPTASQFEMLATEDLGYSLPRSLPGFAQSPALREWVRGL